MIDALAVSEDLKRVRLESPLVHNVTNFVVMNWTANCLLAIGASPVMAHAPEELDEMVALSRALVVNIGTLSRDWVESMRLSLRAAQGLERPMVLDPVGAGATRFRTRTLRDFLEETPPTVLRGNASEILALNSDQGETKGVDSSHASDAALEAARELSKRHGCVVCVSGAVDYVVHESKSARIVNGAQIMTRITGMGCAATALIGAFVAVQPSPFRATVSAMTVMGVAGELAASQAKGPGSFQPAFLDALHSIDESTLRSHSRLESR